MGCDQELRRQDLHSASLWIGGHSGEGGANLKNLVSGKVGNLGGRIRALDGVEECAPLPAYTNVPAMALLPGNSIIWTSPVSST